MNPKDSAEGKVGALIQAHMSNKETSLYNVKSFRNGLLQLLHDREVATRIAERKMIALDNYQGHTFSDSTNWRGKFEKFIENNERRLAQLKRNKEPSN